MSAGQRLKLWQHANDCLPGNNEA